MWYDIVKLLSTTQRSSPKLHIPGNPLDGIKKFVERNHTIVKA
jgi:hypothetical protein